MKALILAGGFGTRLRPLTYTRPKHLLPIGNRPHIEHVFDLLQRYGVDHVVLLTSYLAERFQETVALALERGLTVDVTHEAEPLGTAGAIKNAEEFVGDSTFLVFNGDVLCDFDLKSLIDRHHARRAVATIALIPVDDPSAFGVVPRDSDGRVLGFIEKPPPGEAPTNDINAGIYVMEPEALERIPAGKEWSAERSLFPDLVAEGNALFAQRMNGYWMDIGTPEKYLAANMDILARRFDAGAPIPRRGSLIAPDAIVSGEAKLSSVCVGAGALVGEGASIVRSVLLPGVVVGDGAQIDGSILGERAIVENGARATGVTLGDGALVRKGNDL